MKEILKDPDIMKQLILSKLCKKAKPLEDIDFEEEEMTYEEWRAYLDQSLKEQGTKLFTLATLPDTIRYKKMIETGIGLGDITPLGKVAPMALKKIGLNFSISQLSHNRPVEAYERVL